MPGRLDSSSVPCIARAPLAELGAVEIADLLLLDLVLRRTAAIVLAPEPTRVHAIRYEQREGDITRAALDPAIADAVAARLAIVTGLDIAANGPQVGRLRVRLSRGDGRPTDLLVALRPTPLGFAVELRRIVDPTELTTSFAATGLPDIAAGGEQHGRYRLVCELGQGGMGVVYRAEHIALLKPVALKVLHHGIAEDPALAAQFVLEARAPCRVRHPGIVDVTDFGTMPDGRAFIVMELVEAPTLSQLLRAGPLIPRRAVAIARRIADALAAVGAHGVVHRDLKPANIFVTPDDKVKLVDFGVASVRPPGAATTHGMRAYLSGTPAYMAPEQSLGERADTRADIYSLGCVLFEMISGTPPFTAGSRLALAAEHSAGPVPTLESPHGPLPDLLRQLVERALAKKPAERFQTGEEIGAELDRVAELMDRQGWRRWLPL